MCGAAFTSRSRSCSASRDQLELVIFEVAQPAVDQLGRGRRGVAGEVVALDQQHFQAVERRLAGDRAAVDAAADDEQVVFGHRPSVTVGVERSRDTFLDFARNERGLGYRSGPPISAVHEKAHTRPAVAPADPRLHRRKRRPRGQARDRARVRRCRAHDKIMLKALLKDMADEGLIDSAPGRAFHAMGGLPKVTVLRIVDVDDGGNLWAVPERWEAETPVPRLRVRERKRGQLGVGTRVLARTEEAGSGWIAHPMKTLAPSSEQMLGRAARRKGGSPLAAGRREEGAPRICGVGRGRGGGRATWCWRRRPGGRRGSPPRSSSGWAIRSRRAVSR